MADNCRTDETLRMTGPDLVLPHGHLRSSLQTQHRLASVAPRVMHAPCLSKDHYSTAGSEFTSPSNADGSSAQQLDAVKCTKAQANTLEKPTCPAFQSSPTGRLAAMSGGGSIDGKLGVTPGNKHGSCMKATEQTGIACASTLVKQKDGQQGLSAPDALPLVSQAFRPQPGAATTYAPAAGACCLATDAACRATCTWWRPCWSKAYLKFCGRLRKENNPGKTSIGDREPGAQTGISQDGGRTCK